ncbi:DUF29 domain-containing protein [Funiculus sociatus GB2-A5]|uniref:DUF29 domain-containing protein n=1 Tax=Funiculus sociatus GB2-A5 TaxID=2933946 RepID=A0ABV0JLK3_9CYAN|nr:MULTISPECIES: DUF29 domain-containing protein [unclassified Trichocoleus]MBD1908334.1 DUF29 domain-containing protein [Trichocoleus sp. FACHB-832]MBD2065577.1 DUF29 domain-containing protein [Trichocoleus sp. FACHB-6]
MQTKQDWEWLAASSEYQTAIAVQELLREEKWMEASEGLAFLIESMGKSKRLSLKSQLIRLMSHVIKWKCQPGLRSASWSISIRSARLEIEDIQEEVPSLNRNFIESIWDKSFSRAVKNAEEEMGMKCQLTSLSWEEVFDEKYSLLAEN